MKDSQRKIALSMGWTPMLCHHFQRHHLREEALREVLLLSIHELQRGKQTRDIVK